MSTTAEKAAVLRRRQSLLAVLFFADGQTLRARQLREEIEEVHGLIATVDRIRADLLWLAEVGMISLRDDTAQLTERGREVVAGRAVLPGAA
ncbi:MAG: hypothetical protein LBF61_02675 [Azoarcus sp.]|nr:hypothetical protein [Azoarcus sp.]